MNKTEQVNLEAEHYEVLAFKIFELLKGEKIYIAKRAIKEVQDLFDYHSVIS